MHPYKVILIVFASAGLSASCTHKPAESVFPSSCIDSRDELLGLDFDAFDQDMNNGWRVVSMRTGCKSAAAGLIRDYRNVATISDNQMQLLYWHEGQLRAENNQSKQAIDLFQQSYSSASDPEWIAYAKATIAFLNNNMTSLNEAKAQLLALPEPDGWEDEVKAIKEKYGFTMTWPANLDVIEGLIRCFGRPYKEAYGQDCRSSQPIISEEK